MEWKEESEQDRKYVLLLGNLSYILTLGPVLARKRKK